MRRNITIHSAQLKKEIFLTGKYTEAFPGKGTQDHGMASNIPVHPDLRLQFHRLIPHVIELADLWGPDGQRVDEATITVLGFTLSGEGDKEGVSIIATRELDNAKLVNVQTPFQPWDDQIAPYDGAGELSEIIEDCKAEVYAYIVDKKSQPNNQMELFPEGGVPSGGTGHDDDQDGDDEDDSGRTSDTNPKRNQDESI